MSLAKILPASEFRKTQVKDAPQTEDDGDKRNADFVKRFTAACDKYKETLIAAVAAALEGAKKTSKTNVIVKDKSLTEDCNGFAYTSVLYGFWNKNTHKFEDTVFTKNNIPKPFDMVKKELEEMGYKLEDITDRSRSRAIFLKLSW